MYWRVRIKQQTDTYNTIFLMYENDFKAIHICNICSWHEDGDWKTSELPRSLSFICAMVQVLICMMGFERMVLFAEWKSEMTMLEYYKIKHRRITV